MLIPFGAYLPDQPAYQNTGTNYVLNVVPKLKSFGPINSLSAYSNALTARAQGGFSGRDTAGNVTTFAGDATKLYRLTAVSFADVSRLAGGAYATAAEGQWKFAQFGLLVIAVNGVDVAQKWTLASSSNFSALGGTPPVAKYVTVIGNFVVMANITGAPQRAKWSATGNAEDWTIAQATQSDQQDMETEFGAVTGVWGGNEYGIVFQERAVQRFTYVGTPSIFQRNVVDNRGCIAPNSIAGYGRMVFFLADDGMFVTDGSGPSTPIGAEQINKTLLADLDTSYIERVYAVTDPVNTLYIMIYPGSGSINGTPNKCLIFNWVTKTWGYAEFMCEMLWSPLSLGYTLEGLDAISSSIDLLGPSLDSRLWTGGTLQLAAFDTAHKLAFFTGSLLTATIDTGEFALEGKRVFVEGVRPLVDGGTVTASIGSRATPDGTVTYATATAPGSDGICPQRVSTRFARARVSIAAANGWTHAMGVEPYFSGEGKR